MASTSGAATCCASGPSHSPLKPFRAAHGKWERPPTSMASAVLILTMPPEFEGTLINWERECHKAASFWLVCLAWGGGIDRLSQLIPFYPIR